MLFLWTRLFAAEVTLLKDVSQLFPTLLNMSRRSDEKKQPSFPPPLKKALLFGLFLL
jgi:hypothetical protein